jgi:hypothetical protein
MFMLITLVLLSELNLSVYDNIVSRCIMFCQQKDSSMSKITLLPKSYYLSENLAPANINAAMIIVASAAPNFIS